MMELTGSNEYKVRRVIHWFKKGWSRAEPQVKPFSETDSKIQTVILQRLELREDDIPILLYFRDPDCWCLLTVLELIWSKDSDIQRVNCDDISKMNWSWGNLSEEEKQRDCQNKIKLSPWLHLETKAGDSFEILLGQQNCLIWNAVNQLRHLHATYTS